MRWRISRSTCRAAFASWTPVRARPPTNTTSPAQRYCGLDLGVGDHAWDYSQLDVLGDLETLPFPDATFEAAINIVTLEHVLHPDRVICELGRVLAPGGRFLLVAPLQWEEHQQPHDYGRFTRYRARSPAAAGRVYRHFDPARGRHFPADLAAPAERAAILSRTADAGGGDVFRAAGAGAAAARPPGQGQVFYTGIYMFRAQAFLIAVLSTAAFGAGVLRRFRARVHSTCRCLRPAAIGLGSESPVAGLHSRAAQDVQVPGHAKTRSRRRLPRVPSR